MVVVVISVSFQRLVWGIVLEIAARNPFEMTVIIPDVSYWPAAVG